MNIYVMLGLVLLMSALGSFVGCWVFVKVFEWDKIKVFTKLEVSKDALNTFLNLRVKER